MNPCVSKLCPNCGLCCDSSLFADVELRVGDKPKLLEKSGLKLWKKGANKLAFAQPCACFDGKLCGIYANRPKRCRLFDCGLLKRVESGHMAPAAALRKIVATRARVGKIRDRMRSLGNNDESISLTQRYADLMREPMDFSKPDEIEMRAELMMEVGSLMESLEMDFLT